jgi:putative nucleotidyltransferase with HDIG domain
MVEMLWWHSLASAHIAEVVVDHRGWRLEADIFSICLLHDIGKLFLIQLSGDLQQRKKTGTPVNSDDLLVLMDEHHERLGAKILQTMGYPDTFAKMVANHHRQANASTPRALTVLQQADLLAKAAGFGLGRETPPMIDAACQELGINDALKDEAITTIVQRMEQLRFVFG